MGAGGQAIVLPGDRKLKTKRALYSKPPFTLGELKKAIPPHCFQRSLLRSFSYLFNDFAVAFFLYFVATNYISLLPYPLSYLAWPIYGYLQGCIFTGVWVIGHECGHNAFSNYEWLDDSVGFIIQTALLFPYFSFKYSHRRHHSGTGSLEREEVNVPILKSQVPSYFRYLDNLPCRFFMLAFILVFGLPLYLFFNFKAQNHDNFFNHFYPYSPMYTDHQRTQVFITDLGILTVIYGLYSLVVQKGLAWVLLIYGSPLVVTNALIVVLTFLNHTHSSVPFYDSSEWNWMRGALATVDRDFGLLGKVVHSATSTHVAHHLFKKMPHYHTIEATTAMKPILGDYYQFDDTPMIAALWREFKECVYVEQDEFDKNKGLYWFKNKVSLD